MCVLGTGTASWPSAKAVRAVLAQICTYALVLYSGDKEPSGTIIYTDHMSERGSHDLTIAALYIRGQSPNQLVYVYYYVVNVNVEPLTWSKSQQIGKPSVCKHHLHDKLHYAKQQPVSRPYELVTACTAWRPSSGLHVDFMAG